MAYIGNSQEEERYSRNVEYCLLWRNGTAVATACRVVFILLDLGVTDILRGFSLLSSAYAIFVTGTFEILAVRSVW